MTQVSGTANTPIAAAQRHRGRQSTHQTKKCKGAKCGTQVQVFRTYCHQLVLILAAAGLFSTSVMAHPGAGIAIDRIGQVYFLDTGSGLWKIDTQGHLTKLSGLLNHWLAIDLDNRFANTSLPTGALGEISKVGADPTLLLSSDYPIAIGQDGNLYYPSGRAGNLQLMKMNPSGMSTVMVTLPATVNGKPLPHIGGIVARPDGSLYYTEDTAIRRIHADGHVSTVVTVRVRVKGPSIPATDEHPYLRGLAVDADGVMFVADTGDARVLKITPNGRITTLLQTQSPWSPTAVALFGNNLYVLEFLHTARDVRRDWLPRVRRIAANGKSEIIATLDQMPGAR